MAKHKTTHAGKTISSPKFGGGSYHCYGKRVRAGKKRTKVPRVFCRRVHSK